MDKDGLWFVAIDMKCVFWWFVVLEVVPSHLLSSCNHFWKGNSQLRELFAFGLSTTYFQENETKTPITIDVFVSKQTRLCLFSGNFLLGKKQPHMFQDGHLGLLFW